MFNVIASQAWQSCLFFYYREGQKPRGNLGHFPRHSEGAPSLCHSEGAQRPKNLGGDMVGFFATLRMTVGVDGSIRSRGGNM